MSGGFFRGTSADQDTRFSNKQAKLMKSQKFSPELEHLVVMSKVNMDVLRPWIAKRVIELLGFEDEVLINFIYGLLDVKVANGKEIQISLTGFMEKNTVKFMRELWTHLISAQNNASGVPQQFLDEKQEEARKKKEEADAIETQRRKDKEALDLERVKKMEEGVDKRSSDRAARRSSSRGSPGASNDRLDDVRGTAYGNGVTVKNRSGKRDRSSSVSASPKGKGRSISSERGRGYRSPQRRPITSRRRSPEGSDSPRRRSPHFRRGSRSNSPRRSQSPVLRRVRSPYQRRSRSPGHRRSPPPFRSRRSPSPFQGRRSPYHRRRSPSPPLRRRYSSVRNRRSPSPIRRRRSPSPLRRQMSPIIRRRRSPSPTHRRSPSLVRTSYRRSPREKYASPVRGRRSPVRGDRRSPPPRRRSPSLSDRSSSSPIRCDSPSLIRKTTKQKSPLQSPQERTRSAENRSPAPHQSSSSEGSLQRKSKNRNDYHKRVAALSPSPEKSPLNRNPSPGARSVREKRRLSSPLESPMKRPKEKIASYGSSSPSRKPRDQKLCHDSPKESEEEEDHKPKSLERRSRDTSRISKQKQEMKRGSNVPTVYKDSTAETQRTENPGEGKKADDKNRSHSKNTKDNEQHHKPGFSHTSVEIVDHGNKSGGMDSGSEDSDKGRIADKEKRKNKRSEKQEVTSDDDYRDDSGIDRKETKKRKKEEKRLRKEKKRQKREERRRKKEERRAGKQKVKNSSDASGSDGEQITARGFHSSDDEEDAVRKKLEIELRKKALESLKAKKAISH